MTNIDSTIDQLIQTQAQLSELKKLESSLKSDIADYFSAGVQEQLAGKDYGAGTANLQTEQHKIKIVLTKKVKYDQDGLRGLYVKIKESGDNPDEYIKTEFDVSESAFKAWPEKIKAAFAPFRTTSLSSPTITVEKK